MIKKSQMRFVLFTMMILLVIFTVLYVEYIIINKKTHDRYVENLLDNALASIDYSNKTNLDYVYIEDSTGTKIEANNSETIDINVFRAIYQRISSARNIQSIYSNENDFYYKLVIKEVDNKVCKVFVLMDMTNSIKIIYQNNIKVLTYIATIYAGLFVITYLLSFRVFEPLKQTLNKQKRFISDASHELKTPITIIKANATVLASESSNKWLKNITEQTERLEFLVNDMLSLARLDEQKKIVSLVTFNLSHLANETLLPFDAVAFESEKTLNLDIQDNIFITADSQSIKKIMTILMDNAIKYAIKHSEIVAKLKKEKGYIKFSVKNKGSSIKEEDSNKVFERFYRGANSRNRESGGCGLGLSIAKSIADANKWKIFADSHYGISMEICLVIKTKK